MRKFLGASFSCVKFLEVDDCEVFGSDCFLVKEVLKSHYFLMKI